MLRSPLVLRGHSFQEIQMKFKCKQSGNIIEFTAEHDIESMKNDSNYEVVTDHKKETKKKSSWLDKDE